MEPFTDICFRWSCLLLSSTTGRNSVVVVEGCFCVLHASSEQETGRRFFQVYLLPYCIYKVAAEKKQNLV